MMENMPNSVVFPNFVFNNDNICLGFDDPAQHKHHCIWNYKISFNYPAESVGPLLSGDTKLVEQLQNRILELEKLLEKAKKDVAKRPAPQKPQTLHTGSRLVQVSLFLRRVTY